MLQIMSNTHPSESSQSCPLSDTVIRTAGQSDLEAMRRSLKPAFPRSLEDDLIDQSNGDVSIFLAYQQENIAGAGFLRWLGPRDDVAARLHPQAAEIYRLSVLEPEQGKGIGTRLVQTMEQAAISAGFPAVSLGVAYDNPRAYALYLRLNFLPVEPQEYYDEYRYQLPGQNIQTVRDRCRFMVKALQPG